MPALRVHRSPWRDFPDVVVQTTIAKLKAHPDYAKAKAGDPASGIRVVSDLLKPGKVTFRIDAIVPVLQLDANKRNSIPISYAALTRIAEAFAAHAGPLSYLKRWPEV